MFRVVRLLALLLFRVRTEECPATSAGSSGGDASGSCGARVAGDSPVGAPLRPGLRLPRSSPALADVIGLDDAKAMLSEAIVVPLSSPNLADGKTLARLFWRSGERSAVLLSGPSGLGKSALVEAAAASAGAQLLPVLAAEVPNKDFCRIALEAATANSGRPVVILIEALEAAPHAAGAIRQCLREVLGRSASSEDSPPAPRIAIVATMERDRRLSPAEHAVFGYVTRLGLPTEPQRKQFLLRLLAQISRVDAQWGSALRESAVATLASLTANYTFAEIDMIVRRAFVRSTSLEAGSARDPVALHHFEQIIVEMAPQAGDAFNETITDSELSGTSGAAVPAGASGKEGDGKKGTKKKSKDSKDPMDGIFGWCNFWLPESLHLPPVVWAMLIFGILAHFMARSTYQPYGHRKRRGGAGGRNMFGDMGGGSSPYPSFGHESPLNDWSFPGGSPFANFPPPPGMPRTGGEGAPAGGMMGGSAAAGSSDGVMPQAQQAPQVLRPEASSGGGDD